MDDINARLAELLNDPDSMEKVRIMAESLLNDGEGQKDDDGAVPPFSLPPEISPADLSRILNLLSKIRASKDDDRTKLIEALKPLLSEPRRKKADAAIKLLKLVEILPILKDGGLLNF